MSTFVLVGGAWLGAWVWRDVEDALVANGHRAYAVTLTGLGDRSHLNDTGVDLDVHVDDIVHVLDYEELDDVVLVGHSYGIFPVVGAADRRPRAIGRLVYLDTGIPQAGQAVMDTFEPQRRQWVLQQTDNGQRDWRMPAFTDLDAMASLSGLDTADRERLERLATPHPVRTLTQPLQLSEPLAHVTRTGIFCTRNGMSTSAVARLVAGGGEGLDLLRSAVFTFFDLDTGHFPMLSACGQLADTLIQAADGAGDLLPNGA